MDLKCANCERPVEDGDPECVQVLHRTIDDQINICPACQETVLTMKIVLKRESVKDDFKFEQYLPVECEKT